jgi:hypothetical protein
MKKLLLSVILLTSTLVSGQANKETLKGLLSKGYEIKTSLFDGDDTAIILQKGNSAYICELGHRRIGTEFIFRTYECYELE